MKKQKFYHQAQTDKKFGIRKKINLSERSGRGRIAGGLSVVPALFMSIVYSIEKWTLSVY